MEIPKQLIDKQIKKICYKCRKVYSVKNSRCTYKNCRYRFARTTKVKFA